MMELPPERDVLSGFDIAGSLDLLAERGGYQSMRSRQRRRSFEISIIDHIAKKVLEVTIDKMIHGDPQIRGPKGLFVKLSLRSEP